jgi:predicted transcriptional regulator
MPLVSKTVRDLMIPLDDYPSVNVEATVKDAVLVLSESFLTLKEKRHRTVFVMDDDRKLVGILDFRRICEALVPQTVSTLTKEIDRFGLGPTFRDSGFDEISAESAGFKEKVLKEGQLKVKDIMLPIRGAIDIDSGLLNAIRMKCKNKVTVLPVYEGARVVGVLRDVELFMAVAAVFRN